MFNIQERLTAFANLGAGWIMWLLILLSVICVAIIIERTYYLISTRDDVAALRANIVTLLNADDIDGAKKKLETSKSFEASIIRSAIEDVTKGAAAVEKRLSAEIIIVKQRMERNLAFLGTVGNNAPFVGLLGTVIGVIRAFQKMELQGNQVSDALMREIGEALVATAIGLLVALPAVAFFNLFNRMIKARIQWASAMGDDLLAYILSKKDS